MTRTVFDNSMVAHVYAQQSQHEGRSNNGNFWFRGGALYSYSTCMMVTFMHKGERFVFENREKYSITTSAKHMSQIHSGTFPDPVRHFYVKDLDYANGTRDASHSILDAILYGVENDHPNALKDAIVKVIKGNINQAIESQNKSKRARTYKDMHLRDVANRMAAANDLTEIFRVKSKVKIPADIQGAADAAAESIKQEAAKRKKEREEREARARIADADKFAEWQQGAPVSCPMSYRAAPDGSVYMRIVGEELQTSQNVRVPLSEALRAFKMVKYCMDKGIDWKRNGARIRVGHFQIDTIKSNGDMKAGCHNFTWAQMRAVAEKAGLLNTEAENVAA